MPILDLLGRLCAEDAGGGVDALERWAPTRLVQMPGVAEAERMGTASRRAARPNRERMLRELGEALDALAADEPLVLVIEDLHWTDIASSDVLAYLAQRSTSARLLVIGSYRPADLGGDGRLQTVRQGLSPIVGPPSCRWRRGLRTTSGRASPGVSQAQTSTPTWLGAFMRAPEGIRSS